MTKKIYILLGVSILIFVGCQFLTKCGVANVSSNQPAVIQSEVQNLPLKRTSGISEEKWNLAVEAFEIAKSTNRKIGFYGRIVDQNGLPVSGVEVNATLYGWRTSLIHALNDSMGDSKNLVAFSDERGMFTFSEESGTSLSILSFSKAGYLQPEFGMETNFT